MKKTEKFYGTKAWKNLRRRALLACGYVCATCGCSLHGRGRSRVDHIIPRKRRPDLALELGNLQCLCPACDNKKHAEKGAGKAMAETGPDGLPVDADHPWFTSRY